MIAASSPRPARGDASARGSVQAFRDDPQGGTWLRPPLQSFDRCPAHVVAAQAVKAARRVGLPTREVTCRYPLDSSVVAAAARTRRRDVCRPFLVCVGGHAETSCRTRGAARRRPRVEPHFSWRGPRRPAALPPKRGWGASLVSDRSRAQLWLGRPDADPCRMTLGQAAVQARRGLLVLAPDHARWDVPADVMHSRRDAECGRVDSADSRCRGTGGWSAWVRVGVAWWGGPGVLPREPLERWLWPGPPSAGTPLSFARRIFPSTGAA